MELGDKESLKCVTCEGDTSGAHRCWKCQKPCHTIDTCASSSENQEEGFGSKVLCLGCAKIAEPTDNSITDCWSARSEENVAKSSLNGNSSSDAFQLLMKCKQSSVSVIKSKRPKAGHGKTSSAICLLCFKQYQKDNKKKFTFARFNASSLADHMKVHDCSADFISVEDPRAAEAVMVLKEQESRMENSSRSKRPKLQADIAPNVHSDNSCSTSQSLPTDIKQTTCVTSNQTEQVLKPKSSFSVKDVDIEVGPKTEPLGGVGYPQLEENTSKAIPTGKSGQTSLSNFFQEKSATHDKTTLDYIADRISEKVAERISKNKVIPGKHVTNTDGKEETRTSISSNLNEFLSEEQDMELIGENDTWVLRCKVCHLYLGDPIASSALKHKPTGESLATGMAMSAAEYLKYCQGSCSEWRRLKHRMLTHLSGSTKTHQNALQYAKQQAALKNRQRISIRNQLRTAIGVVQTKCAARHYETKIAELHLAGADVGDFGHSRILFPQMIDVACHFIDQETREYLRTSLPNTGLPPHYYVSADKSTNHRISNQVTMVCPVVEGKKTAIPLGMTPVYTKSDGSGGKGEELAEAIFKDLKNHLGVEGGSLLQMQGKVTDGQYINVPFVTSMNKPIFDLLYSAGLSEEELTILLNNKWWECHWDPSHLLDLVFSKFEENSFVKRVLGRVALFHQIFRHGKMHTVAKETAKELNLPFRVTNAYAPQRFMSSSYLSLKRLEISYEAYVETFRDHHNEEEMRYKLCGTDFIFDLCGLLDLLWPLVILMLKAQLQWCPGWKFPAYMKTAIAQLELFSSEIQKPIPSKKASPRLNKHAQDIRKSRFKSVELEPGWIIIDRETNGDFIWLARDVKDCQRDLKELADKIKKELQYRFKTGFPKLNESLHDCLDFGIQFNALCGQRTRQQELPVNQAKFAQVGDQEFKKCVAFVSLLPHVKNRNLALCEELSGSIYWRLKEKLIDVVWGESFLSMFPKFFKVQDDNSGKLKELHLAENSFIKSFEKAETTEFTVSEIYSVILGDGHKETMITVVLQEQEIIKALYTDPLFYSSIGQEFCIIFDIMYAKTGNEAVVESFYGVVRSQEMDGGQSIKVLGDRAKVDWCFPPVLACDRAIDEMSKLYIDGNSSLAIQKHHVPVYKNIKSFRSSQDLSKVLTRIKESKTGLPFLQ